MEGIKSGKFYKENNKIYRVFRTVIEMVKRTSGVTSRVSFVFMGT